MNKGDVIPIMQSNPEEQQASYGLAQMITIQSYIRQFESFGETNLIYSELVENAADANATNVYINSTKDTLTVIDNGVGFDVTLKDGLTFARTNRADQENKTGVKGTGLKNSIGSICKGQLYIFTISKDKEECACINYSLIYNTDKDVPLDRIEHFFKKITPVDPAYQELKKELMDKLEETESKTGTILKAKDCFWGKYGSSAKFKRAINPGGSDRTAFSYYMRHRLKEIKVEIGGKEITPTGPGFTEKDTNHNFLKIFDRTEEKIPLYFNLPNDDKSKSKIVTGYIVFRYSQKYGGGTAARFSGINIIRLGRQMNRDPFNDHDYWFHDYPEGMSYLVADLFFTADIDEVLTLQENKRIISLESKIDGYNFIGDLQEQLRPFKKNLTEYFKEVSEGSGYSNEKKMSDAFIDKLKSGLVSARVFTEEQADRSLIRESSLASGDHLDVLFLKNGQDGRNDVIYECKRFKKDYKSGVRQLMSYILEYYNDFNKIPEVVLVGNEKCDKIINYIELIFGLFRVHTDAGVPVKVTAAFEYFK